MRLSLQDDHSMVFRCCCNVDWRAIAVGVGGTCTAVASLWSRIDEQLKQLAALQTDRGAAVVGQQRLPPRVVASSRPRSDLAVSGEWASEPTNAGIAEKFNRSSGMDNTADNVGAHGELLTEVFQGHTGPVCACVLGAHPLLAMASDRLSLLALCSSAQAAQARTAGCCRRGKRRGHRSWAQRPGRAADGNQCNAPATRASTRRPIRQQRRIRRAISVARRQQDRSPSRTSVCARTAMTAVVNREGDPRKHAINPRP